MNRCGTLWLFWLLFAATGCLFFQTTTADMEDTVAAGRALHEQENGEYSDNDGKWILMGGGKDDSNNEHTLEYYKSHACKPKVHKPKTPTKYVAPKPHFSYAKPHVKPPPVRVQYATRYDDSSDGDTRKTVGHTRPRHDDDNGYRGYGHERDDDNGYRGYGHERDDDNGYRGYGHERNDDNGYGGHGRDYDDNDGYSENGDRKRRMLLSDKDMPSSPHGCYIFVKHGGSSDEDGKRSYSGGHGSGNDGKGSEGDSRSDSESDTRSDSEGDSRSDSEGDSRSDSEGDSRSDSESDSRSDSESYGKGKSSDKKGKSHDDGHKIVVPNNDVANNDVLSSTAAGRKLREWYLA